jgi:pre-mRNA-splicing factor CWC22
LIVSSNLRRYTEIRSEILGEGSDGSEAESDDSDEDDSDDDEGSASVPATKSDAPMQITDMTEEGLRILRRTIYLTIMSSASFEECAHKLLKMTLKAGCVCTLLQHFSTSVIATVLSKFLPLTGLSHTRRRYEMELANMVIECCTQERSYLKFYGLLAARFCELQREYQDAFCQAFLEQYVFVSSLLASCSSS